MRQAAAGGREAFLVAPARMRQCYSTGQKAGISRRLPSQHLQPGRGSAQPHPRAGGRAPNLAAYFNHPPAVLFTSTSANGFFWGG